MKTYTKADLLLAALVGVLLGMVAAAICHGLDRGPATVVDLQRKAVASHAAYWKPDPGTGRPVLVWAREEER